MSTKITQSVAVRAFAILPLLVAGCANPFGSRESDYGRRVSPERLRQVESMDISRFEKTGGPSDEDPVARARTRFDGLESIELSLEECRAAVLENNLALKVALVNPTIANQSVSAEEARFEASFSTRAIWSQTDSPTASSLTDAQAEFGMISPGVQIPLRTGGTATISLPVTRNETNNVFSTLNPSYTSDLELAVSQQLLRGAGRRTNTHAIRIAGYNEQIASAQTKLEAMRQVAAADRAYWRLYRARRELDVRQRQLELAQAQLERARRQVDVGKVAQIEAIRAEAGVAQRLEAILIAQNDVLQGQRALKRVINIPGLDIDTKTVIVPATDPDPVQYEFAVDELADAAVDQRMEMLELELRLAADASTIDFNKNQALPLLTMDYTYRVNGLGGSTSSTFRSTRDNRFEDWSVGLTAQVPIGNDAAMARVRSAILGRLQRLSTKELRRQAIRQEVYDAADNIDAGWQRILAARQSEVLSRRTLDAEQRQFDVGVSTSTDVLDTAARLAEAESSVIRAITDYQTAQIDLAFATGTLLGASRVRWEPVDAPEVNLYGEVGTVFGSEE